MRYLFAVNHPSQFHVFKHLANMLINDGHKCIFFIQQRGIINDLALDQGFEFKYSVSPFWRKKLKGRLGILLRGIIHLIQSNLRVFAYCLGNRVDMMLGTDMAITYVGKLLNKPSFVFTDDDYYLTKEFYINAFPLATHIVTAKEVDVGKYAFKRIAYIGNQKVAYIHPKYFKPDPSILDKYKLIEGQYVIIRIVSFSAVHDSVNHLQTGLSESFLQQVIPKLVKRGNVLINSEKGDLPAFSEYCLSIAPEDMHSLIYYASLLLTDSQSMHVEAGLMGTPSIRSNSWVDKKERISVIDTLEHEYGLGVSISPCNQDEIIQRVTEFSNSSMKDEWGKRVERFYSECTNLTDFLYWLIKDYPQNYLAYKRNQEVIENFK